MYDRQLEYLAAYMENVTGITKGKRPRYINNLLKVFKTFFNYMVKEGYVALTPLQWQARAAKSLRQISFNPQGLRHRKTVRRPFSMSKPQGRHIIKYRKKTIYYWSGGDVVVIILMYPCIQKGTCVMEKLRMITPLVEMDGDEMTRILWAQIKETLLTPYIDLKTVYFDLGLRHRDETEDQVTVDSALAAKKYGVAVKCATITPNAQRVEEYGLRKMWKSPNGTIRTMMDGTVFRTPILVKGVRPTVRTWEKPITIARHAYGDIYRNTEWRVPGKGHAELVFTAEDGTVQRSTIFDFKGPGIIQGIHNLDSSISSFARSCFQYALDVRQDLWFSAKDTISKTYDHLFKDIFQEIYDSEYKAAFENAGITFFYTLIDDAVARIIRSKGGMIWACKNYDGDVMSDMVATAFGSLAMMTSVLVSPDGKYEYEAAHGTVTRHYYRYLKGEETSTNPVATIFAWTGALKKRAELDHLPDLEAFAARLEKATIDTIENGVMTNDLALIFDGPSRAVTSGEFLAAVKERLENG